MKYFSIFLILMSLVSCKTENEKSKATVIPESIRLITICEDLESEIFWTKEQSKKLSDTIYLYQNNSRISMEGYGLSMYVDTFYVDSLGWHCKVYRDNGVFEERLFYSFIHNEPRKVDTIYREENRTERETILLEIKEIESNSPHFDSVPYEVSITGDSFYGGYSRFFYFDPSYGPVGNMVPNLWTFSDCVTIREDFYYDFIEKINFREAVKDLSPKN